MTQLCIVIEIEEVYILKLTRTTILKCTLGSLNTGTFLKSGEAVIRKGDKVRIWSEFTIFHGD